MTSVAQTVNRYVGIPYAETGDTFAGCYCLGLYLLFARNELGKDIPNPATHNAADCAASLADFFFPIASPAYGDLTVFDGGGETLAHVGVWTPLGILHTSRKTGSICQPARRFKNLTFYRPR